MKQNGKYSGENRGILYVLMFFLLFAALLFLGLGGAFLFHAEGDFYSAFRGHLHKGFYFSALSVLVLTAVLYTPISYGISHYFILASRGEARFSAFFFLFRRPKLLGRAMLISILKKILIYGERLVLLLGAAVAEVLLFFGFLLVSGENIFNVQESPFQLAAEFMLGSPWLIGLSVFLWCLVLLGILLINLRYILCKYVVLCYPEIGIFQAIRVGLFSIRSRWRRTLIFYLRYAAYCLLMILTFGFAKKIVKHQKTFSAYACELVEEGFGNYCRHRSRR